MTIARLLSIRRLLISLLNLIDDELIDRGAIPCRTLERNRTLDGARANV